MPSGGWNRGIHSKGPMDGKKHTPEALEKMRLAKLGKHGNHTTPHSIESIAKIKQSRTGQPAWNKGVEMPTSFCDIMSRVQEGKTIPQTVRDKISKSLEGYEQSEEHRQKVYEAQIKGFWFGNVRYQAPPRYCEIWKDVNPRVHAFFNYKCVECGVPETARSHIGHHVFYVKQACCWFNDEGMYYTNLNAPDHKDNDYFIGENPNYFVILCSKCHGKTNGNFINRKRWADHFKEMIDTKYGSKCYFTDDEFKELKEKRG